MSTEVLDSPSVAAAIPRVAQRIVELRQYTLHPGRRDALIDLFEAQFIETQEACGMQLLGQFRDIDEPDRFVWLRAFPDMQMRARALAAFYGGPAWKAHREAANATMIDSDDVLLLRPSALAHRFVLPPRGQAIADDDSVVLATIHHLKASDADDFIALFDRVFVPLLWNASIEVAASFVTERSANTFPALPVRENESVFVWLSRHATLARAEQAQARVDEALDWSPALANEFAAHLSRPTEIRRLSPTARSRLRG